MKRHLKKSSHCTSRNIGIGAEKGRASVYYNQNGTFRSMQATCAPIESWLCFRISGIKAESGGTQKKRIRALVLKSIEKKGTRLRIEITGRLSSVLTRIAARKAAHKIYSLALVCDEEGAPLSQTTL